VTQDQHVNLRLSHVYSQFTSSLSGNAYLSGSKNPCMTLCSDSKDRKPHAPAIWIGGNVGPNKSFDPLPFIRHLESERTNAAKLQSRRSY
jgi:hypothetical protein